MNMTPTKAAILILKHHAYNAQDLQLCVPKSTTLVAADLLCSTGLFEPFEPDGDFNNYTEYKRGFPQVRTTCWTYPLQVIIIFPAAFFGLDPIERQGDRGPESRGYCQLAVASSGTAPRGLAKRFLDTRDDVSMIAVEQLVDGMNLAEAWVEKNLRDSDGSDLLMQQIRGKKSRIDYFSENKITCFISDKEEAENMRLIPEFE
ncbi:hypothetical protein BDY21DRAFT_418604 [Lineolata rhizophorae]|uniref:Uncharacterized protein n=1 Tax=Lineolata rhizophorae TaxID=578093 RepID=A0A6A6PC80_9PEZI|nr:hypothetical protein BDY21DRAFT_418604 [Lineolata rhizophorae]